MRTLLTILLLTTLNAFGQKTEKTSDQTTFVRGKHYSGVIFSADYRLPVFDENDKGRFTPTVAEVDRFEQELQRRIKELNKNRPNQGRHYGPIIDKRLKRYGRQYVGFINDKGERIIHTELNWKRHNKNWKTNFILTFDGGSYHWTIRYNLSKDEFFNFGVNGIAYVPNGSQQKLNAIAGCS